MFVNDTHNTNPGFVPKTNESVNAVQVDLFIIKTDRFFCENKSKSKYNFILTVMNLLYNVNVIKIMQFKEVTNNLLAI